MNWGPLIKSLLHAAYGGAIAGLFVGAGGPISFKKIAVAIAGGAFTGITHWFAEVASLQQK